MQAMHHLMWPQEAADFNETETDMAQQCAAVILRSKKKKKSRKLNEFGCRLLSRRIFCSTAETGETFLSAVVC